MTQFSQTGSVRVGRGPMYEFAASQCAGGGNNLVPNDFSFRAYSCQNVQSIDNAGVVGKATLAFQCSKPADYVNCSLAQIMGTSTKPEWNCENI